jgi:hypothetical protein
MTTKERQAWRNTFSSTDGRAVLMDILNQLGFFADDPAVMDPKLIAHANWMLGRLGARTFNNLAAYTNAIIDCGGLQDTNDNEEGDGRI